MEFNSPMARQFNGPVIDSLLNARHNVFNESEEFMLHRQGLTLENATTEELNLIGKFLYMARPYAMVNDVPEYCDDTFYRIYIQNLAILRQSQSIYDLARMFDQFMPDGRYFVSFQPNGDLLVVLDEQYIAYTPFFKKALDSVFTALPRIDTLTSWDFDKFVYQHRLYTRLISLKNSDWEFNVVEVPPTYEYLIVGKGTKVMTSEDGVEWTGPISTTGNYVSFYDVIYAQGKWIAVSLDSVWVSFDRLSWTKTATVFNRQGTSDVLIQCLYGGGKYLVRRENGYVYMSEDLVNFSLVISSTSNGILAFVEGVWFLVGSVGSPLAPTIHISRDTITWTSHTLPSDIGDRRLLPRVVIYRDNVWYIVSEDLSFWTSSDLENFELHRVTDTEVSSDSVFWSGIYADKYYVFGSHGSGSYISRLAVSRDLIHWDTSPFGPNEISDIMYVDNQWLAMLYENFSTFNNNNILSSTDARDWHEKAIPSDITFTSLAVNVKATNSLRATVVSPSGKLTVNNHIATATIERRT